MSEGGDERESERGYDGGRAAEDSQERDDFGMRMPGRMRGIESLREDVCVPWLVLRRFLAIGHVYANKVGGVAPWQLHTEPRLCSDLLSHLKTQDTVSPLLSHLFEALGGHLLRPSRKRS